MQISMGSWIRNTKDKKERISMKRVSYTMKQVMVLLIFLCVKREFLY